MALVVFTGGARSGKSSAAQRLASARAADGAEVVVAVFGRGSADDAEFAERIARHQTQRPAGWRTLEATDSAGWPARVADDALLVVDCLGTLLGLAMEEAWALTGDGDLVAAAPDALPDGFESEVESRFGLAVAWLLGRCGDTIVVTNEVGDGIVPAYASGRYFRDELGRANRMLVDSAEAAYLCVAGRVLDLGRLPRDAAWPHD